MEDIIACTEQQHYRIISILGEGNSGITYAVEDMTQPEVPLALKVLSFQQTDDWKTLELFEREAKVLSQLQHPGIPRYLDSFHIDTENDRQFCIVQQLAPGKSLAAWVESGWHANEVTVKKIAEQILEILIYLQKLEPPVIHRDIKPQNIIRNEDGSVFLVDFGAVRDTYYTTMMRGSTVVGTFGYMAPEQFRAVAVPATDLYGLAATLLFLLTHRSPAELPTKALGIDFRSHVQISEGFADWLTKMLAPDIYDRFASAQEALNALRKPQLSVKRNSRISIAKVVIGATLVLGVLNTYKWGILSRIGVLPRGICETATLQNYLKHGGDPNARIGDLARKLSGIDERIINYNSKYDAKYGIASLNLPTNFPLIFCASPEGTEMLIKHGANVNISEAGNLILYKAALSDDVNLIKMLLEHGANPNLSFNKYSVVSELVLLRKKEILKLVIKYGANVNFDLNSNSQPALIQAILYDDKDIVELLINKGGKISTQICLASSETSDMKKEYYKQILKVLINYSNTADFKETCSGGTAVINLITASGDSNLVNMAIKQGADINTKEDINGITPLHVASAYGYESVAMLLIKNGANVNSKNKFGYTPLDYAVAKNQLKLIKVLSARRGIGSSKPKLLIIPSQIIFP